MGRDEGMHEASEILDVSLMQQMETDPAGRLLIQDIGDLAWRDGTQSGQRLDGETVGSIQNGPASVLDLVAQRIGAYEVSLLPSLLSLLCQVLHRRRDLIAHRTWIPHLTATLRAVNLTIRPAVLDELDRVSEILVASFQQFVPSDFRNEQERQTWNQYLETIADTRSRWESSVQLVAEQGSLIGAVTYYEPGRMRYGETETPAPEGWSGIRLLGVVPEARGKGVGRHLTESCISLARKHRAEGVLLHTSELMDVARAMYERMGFARDESLDFYPIPDDDFTVMAYRLYI